MGLYDRVECRYPLPDAEAQNLAYQSKSMPASYMDDYLVTAEGKLLKQVFADDADRENGQWEAVDFRGQMEIHTTLELPDQTLRWYSYLLWFRDGVVADVQRDPSWGQILHVRHPNEQS